ncbi:cytochrome c1 heme lyase [Rhizoctonia solani 123E]|uniref:holocytochrome-c synthase n=1 Tax=Rhizoctonia solani 123E TaxID=1423351 RepID=A0A074S2J8_9AGAM|nr:cytochrome c1 heme lyase [Rhizoctonia solani 123E]
MAREHPSIPKASSSQKQVQRFDGESDDDDDTSANKSSNVATAKKRSSAQDTSNLFVKEVDGQDEPIKFYIIDRDVEWGVIADLQTRIEECGGVLVNRRPEEGYTLVDPRTEEGETEIMSHSTQTRRVVSFHFVEESIKRGRLVPLIELSLFIKGDKPVKFHLHSSLPQAEIDRLRDDILLRGGNPDVDISQTQVVIHSRDFRDKILVNRQWRQIELFETSDWLKSCMKMKRFAIAGAGGRLTVPPAPRSIPTSQPGRKPGAPRTEFTVQDDRCLVAWMAYQFGKNQTGRQGNQPYKLLVQDPNQLWWASRHTWQSWRERYKNKRAHLDPLIIQAANDREQNKLPRRREREERLPIFPESDEEDSDEQEGVAQEPEPPVAKARPKRAKRKVLNSDIADEQPDQEPAKPIDRVAKRVKVGSQPAIKTSASQKAREVPPLRTPSPPPREPSDAPPSPGPVFPSARTEPVQEETPVTRPGEDQEREESPSSPTQFENGILDQAVLEGAQGAIARYNAELAQVAANEMESEVGDEEYDDPDVDVVGVTQVGTPPPVNINRSQSSVDESKTESTGKSEQADEIEETGATVLDTIEERLSALAAMFGARYSMVDAYYTMGMDEGMDENAAYEFTELQLRANARQEKAWTNLTPPSWHPPVPGVSPNTAQVPPASLPTSRETSTIPRLDGQKWVYPSEAQFFAAMARKKHSPHAPDMRVVVPIHNAVNERAWNELLAWETGRGAEICGGVKLVSFKGRPGDRTPKAWFKTLLGYQAPFDRHDWVIDRCGTRMRYVIDFYTGRSSSTGSGPMHNSQPNVSFYLDVRPAIDNWEGVKMRLERFWTDWTGWKAIS